MTELTISRLLNKFFIRQKPRFQTKLLLYTVKKNTKMYAVSRDTYRVIPEKS